jgi:hypothetical protein
MPGRPTKLTPTLQRQLCKAVASGLYLEVACELVGVGRSTTYRWLSQADGGEPKYVAFRDALKKARAQAEQRALAAVLRAGKRSWLPMAWFLERSAPQRWGRRDRTPDLLSSTSDAERPRTPEEEGTDDLSEAMRRFPNEIPKVLAAIEVIEEMKSRGRER